MERIALVLSLAHLTFHAISQDYKIDVEKQFLNYCKFYIQKDFARASEFINEDFTKNISKATIAKYLEATFNDNPGIDLNIDSPKILQIDEVNLLNNQFYVKFIYATNLTLKFTSVIHSKDIACFDTTPGKHQTLTEAYQAIYGKENVKFNDTSQTYEIYKITWAIASSKDMQTWKFATVDVWKRHFLEKFIPKELLDNL